MTADHPTPAPARLTPTPEAWALAERAARVHGYPDAPDRTSFAAGWYGAREEFAAELARRDAALADLTRQRDDARALLVEAHDALGRVDCQFWACQGPTLEPVDMETCFVCALLPKLSAALGPVDPEATAEESFDTGAPEHAPLASPYRESAGVVVCIKCGEYWPCLAAQPAGRGEET